jgi:hypothetical protein
VRTITFAILLFASSMSQAQSTLVVSCDCPGFTLWVDGRQMYQMTTSGRVTNLAPGRHLVKADVWTSPFSHSVWYDGPVDLPPNTEVRGRVVRGRGLELYGQSAIAPPPPPVVVAPPPPAYGDPYRRDERWIRRLRDAIGDALRASRYDGADCQRTVVRDLQDADASLSRGDVRNASRVLRSTERDSDRCQRPTQREVRRVLDLIADLRDERREERAERRAAAPRVECWNGSDPGCYNTKNGQPPMAGAAFAGLQSAINAVPNVFTKLDTLRSLAGSAYLTSMQATVVVRMFKPHVFQQLDAVKLIAPRLVDPQNGGGLAAELSPHQFQVQDAARIISAQRGD